MQKVCPSTPLVFHPAGGVTASFNAGVFVRLALEKVFEAATTPGSLLEPTTKHF